MTVSHNPRGFTFSSSRSRSDDWLTHPLHPIEIDGVRILPLRRSRRIEVDGVFLGAAIEHKLGVQFVAVDVRVTEMDQSIWPTIDYAYRSARQLFKSSRAATPI